MYGWTEVISLCRCSRATKPTTIYDGNILVIVGDINNFSLLAVTKEKTTTNLLFKPINCKHLDMHKSERLNLCIHLDQSEMHWRTSGSGMQLPN